MLPDREKITYLVKKEKESHSLGYRKGQNALRITRRQELGL